MVKASIHKPSYQEQTLFCTTCQFIHCLNKQSCKILEVSELSGPSVPAYLTVWEGGCCIQGRVDERARQVWDGVQRHMSMDMGIQVQRRGCRLLWAQELMTRRKGSSRHC